MSLDSATVSMSRNIAEYIEREKFTPEHPATAPQIATQFHIHPSIVRSCINLARITGIPICSNPKGYFYSNQREHVEATIANMENRINRQLQAINGLHAALGDDLK